MFTPECGNHDRCGALTAMAYVFLMLQSGSGAVRKMAHLRSRSSSWTWLQLGALGFHECGSGSGALFFHSMAPTPALFVFTHWYFRLCWCASS